MEISSVYFGTCEIDSGEDLYLDHQEISVNGRISKCRFHIFQELTSDKKKIDICQILLDKLPKLDQLARAKIQKNYESDDNLVQDYIQFHFDEVADEVAGKLGTAKKDHDLFLAALELDAVWFSPKYKGMKATDKIELTLDYSIGKDQFTDELLCVRFNKKGKIKSLDHES